jgi:hypothetical protein
MCFIVHAGPGTQGYWPESGSLFDPPRIKLLYRAMLENVSFPKQSRIRRGHATMMKRESPTSARDWTKRSSMRRLSE